MINGIQEQINVRNTQYRSSRLTERSDLKHRKGYVLHTFSLKTICFTHKCILASFSFWLSCLTNKQLEVRLNKKDVQAPLIMRLHVTKKKNMIKSCSDEAFSCRYQKK